jgi:hypothetical protein
MFYKKIAGNNPGPALKLWEGAKNIMLKMRWLVNRGVV